MVVPFNPIDVPLYGYRLIEANAGTGKTHAVINIYMRLLTGHGSAETGFFRPLQPNEILVVTFTEAATRELKQRIRQKILLAMDMIRSGQERGVDDTLRRILNENSDHVQLEYLLKRAERQMDDASIFTIHAFCYHILTRYSLEFGALFDKQLIANDMLLKREAIIEFWRTAFYQASHEEVTELYKIWRTPDQLLKSISPFMWLHDAPCVTHDNKTFQERYTLLQNRATQVKTCWLQERTQILEHLLPLNLSKKIYHAKNLAGWKRAIDAWSVSTEIIPPKALSFFRSKTLKKYSQETSIARCCDFFEDVETYFRVPHTFKDILFSNIMGKFRQYFKQYKEKKQCIIFDDLLIELDNLLQKKEGQSFRKKIGLAFPIAIIDEFQDTDRVQSRIFESIYSCGQKRSGLFMVGDPKQSIYAFRGADIFNYARIKEQVDGYYTLSENWRASPDMVQVCNRLFFSVSPPFLDRESLHCQPSSSVYKAAEYYFTCKEKHALQIWCVDQSKPMSMENYRDSMTQAMVCEIKEMLMLAAQDQAFFYEKGEKIKVSAKDIVILVRSQKEADFVGKYLTDAGIASVCMGQKISVMHTREATYLYILLQAFSAPWDMGKLLAAIGSPLMETTLDELKKIKEDAQQKGALMKRFYAYRALWKKKGILAAIRSFLYEYNIQNRLFGKRSLTNIFHIAELLSSYETADFCPEALLIWFATCIKDEYPDADFYLRLEHDDDPIRIMTMHKAKGLEYRIVFIPYACFLPNDQNRYGVVWHIPPDDQIVLDLTESLEAKKQSSNEQFAEEVRLLYVAITRAKHRCYLGLGPIQRRAKKDTLIELHKTAIGHLLGFRAAIEAAELFHYLKERWHTNNTIKVSVPKMMPSAVIEPYKHHESNIKQPMIDMACCESSVHHDPFMDHGDVVFACPTQRVKGAYTVSFMHEKSILNFPEQNGKRFFRALMVAISHEVDGMSLKKLAVMVARLLRTYGFSADWQPIIIEVMTALLYQPLWNAKQQCSVCLSEVTPDAWYPSMRFCMPISSGFVQDEGPYDPYWDAIKTHPSIQKDGIFRETVDGVFMQGGRYYIIDYKLHVLGDTIEAYNEHHLSGAVKKYRDDLLSQLCTLALHRFLKHRVEGYTYDAFGGVFYIFIRGITPHHQHGVLFTRPPFERIQAFENLIIQGE